MNVDALKLLGISGKTARESSVREPLGRLAREWEKNGDFWTLDSCLETMTSHPSIVSAALVDEMTGEWAGWYLATLQDTAAELLYIFTASAYRGRGVAAILLGNLIANPDGIPAASSLFLEVRPTNSAAIRLYEKFGFNLISRRTRYYADGEDALVYQLNFER